MKILFDSQAFTMQRYGGISRYFSNLATGLDDLGESVRVCGGLYQNAHLASLPKRLVQGKARKSYPPKTGSLVYSLNLAYCYFGVRSFSPDIVHETYYSAINWSPKKPRVITVYDMIHELFPQSFINHKSLSYQKRKAITRADHIICISRSTKNDLMDFFSVPPEKISVVHLATDLNPLSHSRPLGYPKPFLLYVGSREPYKNFNVLVRAFAQSKRINSEFDLIAFGGGAFSDHERNLITSLGLDNSKVRQISGGDDLLASCYGSASVFIYPSLYEGFGIPPLEAMTLGCPVISSNTSSMPEVIGDAAEYFDPQSVDHLMHCLENVLTHESLQKDLINRGFKRVQEFSWKKCCQETLAVYNQLNPNHEN